MSLDFTPEHDARAELSQLALKALDVLEAQYDGDGQLGDALIVFEVTRDEGDEVATYTHWVATTDRAVVLQGLVTTADKSLGPE